MALWLIIGCLGTLPGCSLYDAMFSVFGGAYTGGGHSYEEKRADYDAQIRAAEEGSEF